MLRLSALAGVSRAQECPLHYHKCPNCCDVDATCECDHFCPMHPEAWWRDGCSVAPRNSGGDFVCPKGYKKCPACCDVDSDCKCDDVCGKVFPLGFDCSLTPGEDEYSSAGPGAVCPGGYHDCGAGGVCDIEANCLQDQHCGAVPPGFPCTLPRRVNTDGSVVSSGLIQVYDVPMGWNAAEQDCVQRGGHLASLHSAADYHQLKQSVQNTRIVGSVWVGGYEKTGEDDWQWIDGSAMDRRFLATVDTGFAIETGPYTNSGGGCSTSGGATAHCRHRDENTSALHGRQFLGVKGGC